MKDLQRALRQVARRSAVATAVAAALGTSVAHGQTMTIDEVIVTATKRSENLQTVPVAITALSGDQLQDKGIFDVLSLDRAVPGLKINNSGNDPQPILRGAGVAGTTDVAVPYYVDGIYRPHSGQGLVSYLDVERVEVLRGPQGTLFGRNTYGGLIDIVTKKPTTDKFDYGAALTGGSYSEKKIEGFVNVPLGDRLALRVTGAGEKHDPYVENVYNRDAGLKDADYSYGRAQLLWKPVDTFSANLGFTYWHDTANGNADYSYKCLGIPVNPTLTVNGVHPLDGITGVIDPRCGVRPGYAGGRSQAFGPGNPTDAVIPDPYKVSFDYKPHRDIKETSVTLRLDWEVLNHTLTINAAEFDYSELRLTDTDLSPNPALIAGQFIKTKAHSVDVTLNSKTDGALKYTVGAFLYDDSKPGNNSSGFLWGYTDAYYCAKGGPQKPCWASWLYSGNGGTKSTALYGQATYALTSKLGVTGGARYSKDERNFYSLNVDPTTLLNTLPSYSGTPKVDNGSASHTDWRAGLEYQVDKQTMAYAYVATGYISGSVQALTNKLLDPQISKTYEMGLKTTQLDGRLRLNAALYKTDYSNLTTTIFVTVGTAGTIIAQQVPGGSITSKGLELEGQFRATDKLRVDFGLATGTTKFDHFNVGNTLGTIGSDFIDSGGRGWFVMDGKDTAFAPKLTANVGVSYPFAFADSSTLTPEVFGNYSSAYKATNARWFWSNQGSYVMGDFAATWRSPSGKVSVRGYVNNLTNKAVVTEATVFSKGRAMEDFTNPRTWGVRLAYNF